MADHILLTDAYEKRLAARAVPGAYYQRGIGWIIDDDPSPRTAAVALKLFPDLVSTHPELLEIRERLAQDVRPMDMATAYNWPIPARRLRARLEDLG